MQIGAVKSRIVRVRVTNFEWGILNCLTRTKLLGRQERGGARGREREREKLGLRVREEGWTSEEGGIYEYRVRLRIMQIAIVDDAGLGLGLVLVER